MGVWWAVYPQSPNSVVWCESGADSRHLFCQVMHFYIQTTKYFLLFLLSLQINS